MAPKIEIVGMVLAVPYVDDPTLTGRDDPGEVVRLRLEALGFSVQAVSLHIDGMFRVEVSV